MMLDRVNPNFFKKRFYRGIIFFLVLVALAMLPIAPTSVLLPAVLMAVISFAAEGETGYVAVALSVCKNE